jgi:isochorismate synthase
VAAEGRTACVLHFRDSERQRPVDSTPLESHLHDAFLDELPGRLARALAGASGQHFLSISLRARDFRGSPGLPAAGTAVWWGRPADARIRVGAGTAWEFEARGEGRFRELGAAHRALVSRWQASSPDGSGTLRGAFLGFAFSPDFASGTLPNALLSVPRVVAERRGGMTLLHFNGAAGEDPDLLLAEWTGMARELVTAAWPGAPAAEPAPRRVPDLPLPAADPDWATRVNHALRAIEHPPLEKLVLTRRVDLQLAREPSLDRVLEWLAARYPDAAVFAVRRPGISLVGASPERLLGLDYGLVVADALAGSAPRATCDDADQVLGGTLLGDPKELAEHAVVVREILSALEPLCTALVASHAPSLLRLPNVQHLASHVHGRVRPEVGVFELLERMHPTPAVGGAPRAAALDWLRRHGEADRGWYTGGVGWLDDAGGDIWVALRCAALGQRTASLYAGAGIIAGSDAAQELRETGWKLQAMLEALAVD